MANSDEKVCYLHHVRPILNNGGSSVSFELCASVCNRSENQGTCIYIIDFMMGGCPSFSCNTYFSPS